MRINVSAARGVDPICDLDGVPLPSSDLRWAEFLDDLPHGVVHLRGERLFDVEVWVNGQCCVVVPERSPSSESVYDAFDVGYRRGDEEHPAFTREGSKAHNLARIRSEIDASRGQKARIEWKALSRTYNVYLRNHHVLTEYVRQVESDPRVAMDMFQNVEAPVVREELLGILDQYLHNFVAAAKTLVDHTRVLTDPYEGSHFHAEYEARKDVVATDPAVKFIGDFRNMILHRSIPYVGTTVTGLKGGSDASNLRTTLHISAADLLRWDKWSRPARSYLEGVGDRLTLPSVVSEHKAKIESLSMWVFEQYRVLHGADTFWLNELISEYNWELSGGREGRPRTTVLVPPT